MTIHIVRIVLLIAGWKVTRASAGGAFAGSKS